MLLNAPVSSNSRAVICHPLDLATHLGLKTYNRTFRRVEAGLFLADVVAHLQGRASDAYAAEIAQVNVAIARELDRLAALVVAQARWIEHVVRKAARPPAESAVRYTQPARVELAMRTPKARRYAELLAELEQILRALDAAWYAGALDTPARSRPAACCSATSTAPAGSSSGWRAAWRGGCATTARPPAIGTCWSSAPDAGRSRPSRPRRWPTKAPKR